MKLQAICHESVFCRTRKVGGTDLLLDRLEQKLRDLWRPQLVPGQGCLAARNNEQPNYMCEVVDGESVEMSSGEYGQQWRRFAYPILAFLLIFLVSLLVFVSDSVFFILFIIFDRFAGVSIIVRVITASEVCCGASSIVCYGAPGSNGGVCRSEGRGEW